MTLQALITKVAQKGSYAIDPAARIIGSTDQTTIQLLAITQDKIREMADTYAWTKLYASASFTLAAGQTLYALPAAFSYYHFETFWNQSTRWRIVGPMSPQEYAEFVGYGLNTTVYKRFQVRGLADNQIQITPPPTSADDGQTVIFEYIAARSVRPQSWLAGTAFSAGAYCFNNGNYYQTTGGGSGGSAPVHTSGTVGLWTYFSGIYDQFIADTDEPVLSSRILERGVFEEFAQIKGLESVVSSFTNMLNEEFSKDRPGKIIYTDNQYRQSLSARSGVVSFGGK